MIIILSSHLIISGKPISMKVAIVTNLFSFDSFSPKNGAPRIAIYPT